MIIDDDILINPILELREILKTISFSNYQDLADNRDYWINSLKLAKQSLNTFSPDFIYDYYLVLRKTQGVENYYYDIDVINTLA